MLLVWLRTKTDKWASIAPDFVLSVVVALEMVVQHVRVFFPKLDLEGSNKIVQRNSKWRNALNAVDVALL